VSAENSDRLQFYFRILEMRLTRRVCIDTSVFKFRTPDMSV